ncbi:MAG: DUF1345 domain-containing protein [Propionibacteriaceae bacterium]|jgi:uncharacterized membrane protein|nr:DUF1345 domain-containing protein [Propionibacteriaceae bacterium]
MIDAVPWRHRAEARLAFSSVIGVAIGAAIFFLWRPAYAVLLGWTVVSLIYTITTWLSLSPMDADNTRTHATAEAPAAPVVHALLLVASLASLFGIGFLIAQPSDRPTESAFIAICPVIASWAVIHTLYALGYARVYYSDGQGFNFHSEEPPRYSDFAYVAFTVGMSYAVSDTEVTTSRMRRIMISQALLAFLFGTVFLATLVNILASLAG